MFQSKIRIFVILGLMAISLALVGFMGQSAEPITRKQLREKLVELGYEVEDLVKDEGKEKYSVVFVKNDLNIPVGFEISPSGNYVWLTVNLGEGPTTGNSKTLDLLKQNAKIQPTFFYITEKGLLMAALAVENRGITNAVLKTRAETISTNVGGSKAIWQAE